MKTHLIPLDPSDDITSVRDKMAWGKTTRILIVWPETNEPVLDRRIDVQIIRRRAEELGASLAFVTHDPQVKTHARELGIPVYRTTRDGQAAHWRFRRQKKLVDTLRQTRAVEGLQFQLPETRRTSLPVHRSFQQTVFFRLAIFFIAIIAVGLLAGVLVPRAKIVLTPATQTQTIQFTAFTGPTITTLNPTGAIPARSVTTIVEGRTSVPSTGTLLLPNNHATGRVTFTNLTDVTVIVPAGTIVLTPDQVRFSTDRQVQIPPEVGGAGASTVTALLPGPSGNVLPEAIQSIEGTLGLQLTVTNPVRTTGGTSQTLTAPTDADRQNAYQKLSASLLETAASEIRAQLGSGDLLLTQSPRLLETHEEIYFPAETPSGGIPIPADVVEVSLRLEFQAFAIQEVDLRALAQAVLDSNLEPGIEPIQGTLTYELLNTPEADEENNARWEMKAERTLTASLSGNTAVSLALGQPPASAASRLNAELPLAAPAMIQLTPAWWPWMPFMPFQIEIIGTP